MTIEKPTNQRPNYFAGQYLLEDDFQLDQDYHIDRQRWHHHLLHISGIAERLTVNKGESNLVVNVSEGSAIDSQGRQIILLDSAKVDLIKSYNSSNATIPDGTYTLYIGYDQKKIDQQTTGEENTSRRWQEEPEFKLSSAELTDFIPLAKLTINSNAVSGNIDNSVRFYSGLRLPSYDGEMTLRAKSDGAQSFAELKGSLSIAGTLSVTGNVGIGTITPSEKLEISGGNLKVGGNISATNATLTGNLGIGTTTTPSEKLEISGGNLRVSGNIFATNATLTGNLGIGTTTTPTEKLEISGGNLKVSGNISASNATLTGNLGIGTTDPGTSILKVANSTSDFADISFSGSGMGQLQMLGWSSGWNINAKTAGKHLYLNRDSGDSSNVYIGRGGKELFVQGIDGKVGIGTTTLSAKLQVQIDGKTTDTSLKLEHNGSNFIVRPLSAGGTSSVIENTGGGYLIINPKGDKGFGNVGIGTTTPGATLEVLGSTKDDKAAGLNVTDSDAKSLLYVRNDGKVGIGTIAPKSLLEIRKDASGALGSILTLSNNGGSNNAGAAIDFNGYDVGTNDPTARIRSLDDGNFSSHIAFYSKEPGAANKSLQERLRIQSNGTVKFTGEIQGKLWYSDEYELAVPNNGQKVEIKMRRIDRCFAFITSIEGHFQGGGEHVWVETRNDNYWYLCGQAQQDGVKVKARCIGIPESS